MTGSRRTALAVLLAILGIAFAAAVTWGTSQIVSQHIGLASEPLTAGSTLLPRSAPVTTVFRRTTPEQPARTVTVTTPAPVIVPTTPATSPAPETPAAPHGSPTGEGSGREGDQQAHRDD